MPNYKLSYKSFGEFSILIEWPSEINEAILLDIIDFKSKIEDSVNLQEVIVGYNSLLLVSGYKIHDLDEKMYALNELYHQTSKIKISKSKHWEIPVCYDLEFGVDLEYISKTNNIKVEEIIKLHTERTYTIYFIGFLPGFLYLGGMNDKITIPRKSTPRLKVPKGAVAIGGNQTGIYPEESAGGWNIIGNSPISFFDVKKKNPCFGKIGDTVSFKSISIKEYVDLEIKNASKK